MEDTAQGLAAAEALVALGTTRMAGTMAEATAEAEEEESSGDDDAEDPYAPAEEL